MYKWQQERNGREKDKGLIISVHIPLIFEHLFYKYLVRRLGYKSHQCIKIET